MLLLIDWQGEALKGRREPLSKPLFALFLKDCDPPETDFRPKLAQYGGNLVPKSIDECCRP
ncbi:MAG: hypothetical protein U1E64_12665 [Sphingomonadaceae bacterium]